MFKKIIEQWLGGSFIEVEVDDEEYATNNKYSDLFTSSYEPTVAELLEIIKNQAEEIQRLKKDKDHMVEVLSSLMKEVI